MDVGLDALRALGSSLWEDTKQGGLVELIRPGVGWFHTEAFKYLDSTLPRTCFSQDLSSIIYSILTFIHLIMLFIHLG